MFKPTDRQVELLSLISNPMLEHILAVGGSRSGKTTDFVEAELIRALKYDESRHIVLRQRYKHARLSIWMDTLPKLLQHIDSRLYKTYKGDLVVVFKNKSELWVDGLDDDKRVEKIFGREYATMFFNEISQMSYDAITDAQTRNAMNINGCINKFYYDENPPDEFHYSYTLWIKKLDPTSGMPLSNPLAYGYLYMNPEDNAENLSKQYLNILRNLPTAKRLRFYEGKFAQLENIVFTNWDVVDNDAFPTKPPYVILYGGDFGFTIDPSVCVRVAYHNHQLYIDELVYDFGLTNQMLAKEMKVVGVPMSALI